MAAEQESARVRVARMIEQLEGDSEGLELVAYIAEVLAKRSRRRRRRRTIS